MHPPMCPACIDLTQLALYVFPPSPHHPVPSLFDHVHLAQVYEISPGVLELQLKGLKYYGTVSSALDAMQLRRHME